MDPFSGHQHQNQHNETQSDRKPVRAIREQLAGESIKPLPEQNFHVVKMPVEVAVKGQLLTADAVAGIQAACRRGYERLHKIFGLTEKGEPSFLLDGTKTYGAELEMPVVFRHDGRPARVAPQALQQLLSDRPDERRVVPELGAHNLEFNFTPRLAGSDGLIRMEEELRELMGMVNKQLEKWGAAAAPCGIMFSFTPEDLSVKHLFPKERYHDLSVSLQEHRRGNFDFRLDGTEPLEIKATTMMAESLNTSFQLHFQVPLDQYVEYHRIADLITAPLMAIAANAPLVFGYRGPKESRPDVWSGSIDPARVMLGGDDWIATPLEQFRDVLNTKPLLTADAQAGDVEQLIMQSKTRYPWNRTTLSVDEERKEASIRIENRIASAQPTPADSVAVAAFFYGLMEGMKEELSRTGTDLAKAMHYSMVKENFDRAKLDALDAHIHWYDGKVYSAQELVLNVLLPLAGEGLEKLGFDKNDSDTYLNIIEERAKLGLSPADVVLAKEERLRQEELQQGRPADRAERMRTLTKWYVEKLTEGRPIHTWVEDWAI